MLNGIQCCHEHSAASLTKLGAHAHSQSTRRWGILPRLHEHRRLLRQENEKSWLGFTVIFNHIKHTLLKGLFHAFNVKMLANNDAVLTTLVHQSPRCRLDWSRCRLPAYLGLLPVAVA